MVVAQIGLGLGIIPEARTKRKYSAWDKTVTDTTPHGQKGSFRKVTVTLPQDIYERLIRESARRKIAGEPNQLLSALLREAVTRYLEQLG